MATGSDYWGMECHAARAAISAQLDGELDDVAEHGLTDHLAGCASCAAFATNAATLHRRVRLRAAEPVPDLAPQILAAIGAEDERARIGGLRIGLAVVGITQILIALPALLLGEDAGVPAHTARHLGSFAVALGIGFLVAAWRPARVGGVLPVTAALVACLLLTSAVDVAAGRTEMLSELGGHATEIVGLGLLFVLARDTGQVTWRWGRSTTRGPATP